MDNELDVLRELVVDWSLTDLLREFLCGERQDFPPESWFYRENWLTWHASMLLPELHEMIDREIGKNIALGYRQRVRSLGPGSL